MKDFTENTGIEVEAKFYSVSRRRKGPDTKRSISPE
jgi:hypothetical protein